MNCLISFQISRQYSTTYFFRQFDILHLTYCFKKIIFNSGGVVVAGSNPAVPTIFYHTKQQLRLIFDTLQKSDCLGPVNTNFWRIVSQL